MKKFTKLEQETYRANELAKVLMVERTSYTVLHDEKLRLEARLVESRLEVADLKVARDRQADPIPMLLHCPICSARHIDVGEYASKPHHTHACQVCGHVWRPAVVATVGVRFLPGYKNVVGS